MALTLRFKYGEAVRVGDNITIRVMEHSRGNRVFLQIDAPVDLPVRRLPTQGAGRAQDIDQSCR